MVMVRQEMPDFLLKMAPRQKNQKNILALLGRRHSDRLRFVQALHQTGLTAGGLVLVDNAFRNRRIEIFDRRGDDFRSSLKISFVDSQPRFFDIGLQGRLHGPVPHPALSGFFDILDNRLDIWHADASFQVVIITYSLREFKTFAKLILSCELIIVRLSRADG